MASVLSRIQIIMEANTANYNNELRRARENSSDTFSKISKSAGKMALAAGAAIAGVGVVSTKTAMSFETAMAEIDKTVEFTTNNGLANMRKELQALTTQIPQTFEELAAVTATGGQLGIAEKDLVRFTEVMAKMGVAFDIPAQQAADSMAKIANVFQIPIANIDRLGDAINTLSNNTPATAAQLIDSLQRVGGVAKVFGLSEDATLGLTGALIAMGKPAEVASTAVNSLLTSFSTLDNATKSQLIGFKQLGLDIDEFSDLVAVDGKQAIITYLDAINKLDQSQRIGTNALIIGKEFGDDITMLAGSVGVLENNWAMLGETAETTKVYFGSMDVEFQKISATSANKMKLFKSNIDGVVASIGEAFIPAVNELLLNATPMVAVIGTWASENPELIQQITLIGGALIGSIAGLKLAVDGFEATKTALDGVKLAYTLLASPIGMTVLGLGILLAAGLLVYQNWEKIKQVVNDNLPVFAAIAGVLTIVTGALAAVYGPMLLAAAGTAAMSAATTIWTGVVTIATGVTTAFGAVLAFITSPIGVAVIAIGALVAAGIYLYKNWDEVKAKAIEVWGSISSYVGTKLTEIKNYFSTNFPAMSAIVGGTLKAMGAVFSAGFALIKNTVSTVMAVIKAVISGDFKAIPAIIGSGLKAAAAIVVSMMGNILNIIKATGSKLFEVGKDIVAGLVNGIKQGASSVVTAIGDMASSAVAKAKSVLNIRSPSRVMKTVGEQTAQGMANGIRKGKKAVVTEAQRMAAETIKAVKDGIQSLEKELALFGKNNKLAEFDYDVSVGKYNGAAQSDINKTRELLRALNIKNEEADVTREMVSLQRSIYDASVLYSTELGRMNYELDDIHGKYKNINSEIKDSLRDEAAKLDAVKLRAAAAKSMMDIDRQIALLGNDNLFSQLSYEMNQATGSLYDLDDAMKEAWLSKAKLLEQSRKEAAANESISNSINSINKELALIGDKSGMAELMYDLANADKYANASAAGVEALASAVTKLDNENRAKALAGVMDELVQESPADKIEADYQRRLKVLDDYESQYTALIGVQTAERIAIEKAYIDSKQQLMLGQSAAIFDALSGMAKGFLGEQAGIYRGLYILHKAYVFSSALLSSKKAIMDAWSETPGGYIAKSLAVGKVILSTSEITSAIADLAPKGFKSGGYTGNIGVNQAAGVVHGQEYVFDAQSTKRIGVNNLERIRSGNGAGSKPDNVNINVAVTVNSDGSASVESQSRLGSELGNALAAIAQKQIEKAINPGGLIYRQMR